MDFSQVEVEFQRLKGQFEAGALTEEEFKAQLEELMIEDEEGKWWIIGYETGQWYYHDGEKWVLGEPPRVARPSWLPFISGMQTSLRKWGCRRMAIVLLIGLLGMAGFLLMRDILMKSTGIHFKSPHGVAVDADGSVYVADTGNHRIQVFDSNGNFIIKWGTEGSGDGYFHLPEDVAVDADGKVYVADADNHRIQVFDSNGNFIAKWGSRGRVESRFDDPSSVAVDADGKVYVADTGNHRIQVFDSNGNFIAMWGSEGNGDGQFKRPEGVAVDVQGNVHVADHGNDRIQIFDSNGNFIAKYGYYSDPCGVAVDAQGNVYVVIPGEWLYYPYPGIQVFDSNGNFIAEWRSGGQSDGQFDNPRGVAVDAMGNVYVADTDNDRIQVFDPNGHFIAKWGR